MEESPELVGGSAAGAPRVLDALCQELNMDQETAGEALNTFNSIWSTFILEGEVEHWLACALYVACRKSVIPTVGRGIMEGNCVSLTRILRSAKLSAFWMSLYPAFIYWSMKNSGYSLKNSGYSDNVKGQMKHNV